MDAIGKQDTDAKTADAAAAKFGLNRETLQDLDASGTDVKGGFIMQDTVIVPTGRGFIMRDSIIVRTSG